MSGELWNQPSSGSILGACPACGATIPTSGLLIEYETNRGWPRMFAACPACDEVVHPR